MYTYAIRHSLRCLCDLYVPICSTRQAWRQKKRCIVTEPHRSLTHRTYVSRDVYGSHKLRRRIGICEIRCLSSDISTSAGNFAQKCVLLPCSTHVTKRRRRASTALWQLRQHTYFTSPSAHRARQPLTRTRSSDVTSHSAWRIRV